MINPEIIVALDVPNKKLMEQTLDRMPNSIKWYKIGLELFCSEGPEILTSLKNREKSIFLDLKLHDIPRTVSNAIKTASEHGVDLMTVHAIGGRAMLEEAALAAKSLQDMGYEKISHIEGGFGAIINSEFKIV